MINDCFLYIIILVSAVISAASSNADSLPRPDQFFQREFINNAQRTTPTDIKNPQHAAETPSSTPTTGAHAHRDSPSPELNSSLNFFESDSTGPSSQVSSEKEGTTKSLAEDPSEPFIPIDNLTLLMNGSPNEESTALLKNMATIVKQFDIQPKAIFTMQPPFFLANTISDEKIHSYDFMSIMIRGGEIRMNRNIPAQYEIEKLPAWIAETPEGDVILEGYSNIASFLNTKGELKRSLLILQHENINEEILPHQQKEEAPTLSLQEKDALFINNAKKQLLQKLRERRAQVVTDLHKESF